MRAGPCLVVLLALLLAGPTAARAESKDARYGVDPDVKAFPQGTAKEALASLCKAAEGKKFAYLTAQLADPAFVDDRVKRIYGGKFEEQVLDTANRLDPLTVKRLKRLLKDGKWTIDKTSATVALENGDGKGVRFVKKAGRWYVEHRFAER
jgi:hypothetical protein